MQKAADRKQRAESGTCMGIGGLKLPTAYRLPPTAQKGMTTILVVGFMGVFMLIMGMLTSYAFEQAKYGRALLAREQALHIAEAGLEYYRWFLAHNPGNLTNGTGLPGPYTYTVNDPEGGTLGSASLTVTGNSQCGVLQNIDISSTGTSVQSPGYPRTVSVRYMQHNVAEYAFLINANVWYGSTNAGSGPYYSNGGTREDGTNNSTVGSALTSFSCDSSMGCSPTQTEPGVFGAGSGSALWRYPVSSVDFAGMATNFSTMKTYAQSGGLYFYDASVAGTAQKGWHIILNSDGTMDVYKVTSTSWAYGYPVDDSSYFRANYDIIASQSYVGHYAVPAGCSLVYVQGTLWLEGTAKGKFTILAADPGSFNPDVIVSGNIGYAATDGTTGLTVIAEHSVRIPINSPDTLNLRGIYVAQSGYYGRDFYTSNSGYAPYTVPSGYNSYVTRSNLNVTGSIVSNTRPAVVWGSSSGYLSRTNSYDQVLAFDPPPFTPPTSTDYHYALWNEQ
jgi:hypothetical protein